MHLSWLLLGALTGTASEPTSTMLASGADIQDWRQLGDSPTPKQLQDFLKIHHVSPLAELAVRRLEEQGIAIDVQNAHSILDSLLAHEARLAQIPVAVTPAPLKVLPLSSKDVLTLERPALASAED